MLGYGDEIFRPVALAQDPQQRRLEGVGVDSAAERGEQSTPAQLGLAVRRQIEHRAVGLESVEDRFDRVRGIEQLILVDEREVVIRRVIFGELAVERTGEAANCEVEARR